MNETSAREAAEILRIARREAAPENVLEFEPITKGFWYALAALLPLCVLAVFYMLWKKVARVIQHA